MAGSDARGPLWRKWHMVMQAGQRRDRGHARIVELAIARIQPADLRRQAGAFANQRDTFEFETIDLDLGRVEHREAANHLATHTRLEIIVIAVEGGDVAEQATIVRAHLQAHLIGPHGFRIEFRAGRFGHRIGATVEAAGLEALVRRDITHHPIRELLLQAQRWRDRGPRLARVESHGSIQGGKRRAPERAGGAVVILGLTRVAHAGTERPRRCEFPVDLAISRRAARGQIIPDCAQEGDGRTGQRIQVIGIRLLM